ncbi:MAG: hypothetical protein ACI9MF_002384 [Gammaproteobacteria bacterium]|jgi:hypothetical protein
MMGVSPIQALMLLIPIIVSIILAFKMDASLHKKLPTTKPYKWGYYNGWVGVIGGGT